MDPCYILVCSMTLNTLLNNLIYYIITNLLLVITVCMKIL
jgi:hypothetical protein